jgi:hypothetical protein
MANTIRKMDYFYVMVSNKPGQGAKVVKGLADNGVNLIAFSGFPSGKGAQAVFVPDDAKVFRRAARKLKLKTSKAQKAFLVGGDDRPGAVAKLLGKLADRKINVTAVDAVAAGKGRFGAILWVKQKNVKKAARALGAK